jgi:hypothetical protein
MSHDIRYDINKPNYITKITSMLNVVKHIFINSMLEWTLIFLAL